MERCPNRILSGSISRTEQQAMVPASIMMLALLIFTGFVVPIDYMPSWCRWINYVNPVAYGYEALMINEYHNRRFLCSNYIPDYINANASNLVCDAIGSLPGQSYVNGDSYIGFAYSYYHGHKWRNVGIIAAMMIFNHLVYFIASEYVTAKPSKGEILVFRRGFGPRVSAGNSDIEQSLSGNIPVILEKSNRHDSSNKDVFVGSKSVFHWSNVCYDLKIKGKTQRILNKVDGWVKPGTLTALSKYNF